MKTNQLFFFLWTSLLLLLGYSEGLSLNGRHEHAPRALAFDKRQDEVIKPEFVLRGDFRLPQEIRDTFRGFAPRVPKEALSPSQIERGSSLFHHTYGSTARYTKYVSTTTEPRVAFEFGVEPGLEPGSLIRRGYIYKIHADEKMVDAVASIGKGNMKAGYAEQAEQAVVGRVPWKQVQGWYKIEDFSKEEIAEFRKPRGTLKSMEHVEKHFIVNPEYDAAKYQRLRGAGARPELAGHRETSSAWDMEPWKAHKPEIDHNTGRWTKNSVAQKLKDYEEELTTRASGAGAAEDVVAEAEPAGFSLADVLGIRDLAAEQEVGDAAQFKLGVEFTEASETAEAIEASEAILAVEAAEEAEALAATLALEEAEAAAVAAEGATLLEEVLAFLAIL
ncbi:hypothetical protein HIM_08248 [Hirsutella minnesotensis 3608]|uniref:Enterotoxin n=1 Tax=Hirsutella minnesotensis 3608 TaxID=1043627 RepID=A0A0F7ZYE3_9HYPO|nr:hypothetical protein HIM_08248 [Hirsutella minnesotensis 3608]